MSVIATIIGSLVSVATMVGLPKVTQLIDNLSSKAKGVSETDIIDIVNTMYNEAAKKGQNIVSLLNDKLNSVPFGSYSGRVRDVITDHRRRIKNKIQQVETSMNEINTRAQGIERKANTLMMMSDDYRKTDAGKKEVDKLQQDAKQLVIDTGLVERRIKEN